MGLRTEPSARTEDGMIVPPFSSSFLDSSFCFFFFSSSLSVVEDMFFTFYAAE